MTNPCGINGVRLSCCEYLSVWCIWLYVGGFEPTTTYFVNDLTKLARTEWLWVQISLLSLKLQTWHLLRARSSLTLRQNYRVWIHSETRTWHDNNMLLIPFFKKCWRFTHAKEHHWNKWQICNTSTIWFSVTQNNNQKSKLSINCRVSVQMT